MYAHDDLIEFLTEVLVSANKVPSQTCRNLQEISRFYFREIREHKVSSKISAIRVCKYTLSLLYV